ncbi:hypothetical protein IWQ60_010810 [Tieghemiomyces parasiticus]|uniref:SWIRM domain-containing protein n=1 Tax=Tieghemiomyces parasiticus TaxID=78921 RepID=A0A9W7ZIR7_9FUNG|nr:hypothetical protein IWQ60_010810 [Tieghemiomyces parasiticus]
MVPEPGTHHEKLTGPPTPALESREDGLNLAMSSLASPDPKLNGKDPEADELLPTPPRSVSPIALSWGSLVGPTPGLSIRYTPQEGTVFTNPTADRPPAHPLIALDVYTAFRTDPQALWRWTTLDSRSGPHPSPHASRRTTRRGAGDGSAQSSPRPRSKPRTRREAVIPSKRVRDAMDATSSSSPLLPTKKVAQSPLVESIDLPSPSLKRQTSYSQAPTPVPSSDGDTFEYAAGRGQRSYDTRRQQKIYYNALSNSALTHATPIADEDRGEEVDRESDADSAGYGSATGQRGAPGDATIRGRRRGPTKHTIKRNSRGYPTVSWPKGAPLDVSGDINYKYLTEPERHVCSTLRVPPHQYLQIKDTLINAAREAGVALDEGIVELARTKARQNGEETAPQPIADAAAPADPVATPEFPPSIAVTASPATPSGEAAAKEGTELPATPGTDTVSRASTASPRLPTATSLPDTSRVKESEEKEKPGPSSQVHKPFRKRDAQKLCRIDVNKTSKIVDWFVDMGWLTLT